jgi:Bacteriophage HK97-gp10, putative tail-component
VSGRMLERSLVAGALLVQNDAKERAKWVTGNLRRSIHIGGHTDKASDWNGEGGEVTQPQVSPKRVAVVVGTNVEYARRIEYGFNGTDSRGRRYNQAAQPYLRPALDENRAAVQQEVAKALRDLIKALS